MTASEVSAAPDPSWTAKFRSALGMYVTGVTIVTKRGEDGRLGGLTANSFTSVSLDPPLVLICIGNHVGSYPLFQQPGGFAINVLGDDQRGLAELFASKAQDKFDHVTYRLGVGGAPIIDGSLAWLDCETTQTVQAGDHVVVIGEVKDFGTSSGSPLAYCQGSFFSFNLQQEAVFRSGGKSVIVGCIADYDDRVMLRAVDVNGARKWTLPGVELAQSESGVLPTINTLIKGFGTGVDITFIYSIFEHDDPKSVFILYRGKLTAPPTVGDARLFGEAEVPWDDLANQPIRDVLQRFFKERGFDHFSVYVDLEDGGRVATVHQPPQDWSAYVSDEGE